MQHFLHRALAQQILLRGQSVKFLMQAAQRHHRNRTLKLRLAKKKTEHGDRQIDVDDAQHPCSIPRRRLGQQLHHLDRLIPLALAVIRAFRNGQRGQAPNGQRKPFRGCILDPIQRFSGHAADRHQTEILHTLGTSASRASAVVLRNFTGSVTVKVVPWFRWLATSTSPSCAFTMPYNTARPRPTPLPSALVVKNGSKILERFSGAMPSPVSWTHNSTLSSCGMRRVRIVSLPPPRGCMA